MNDDDDIQRLPAARAGTEVASSSSSKLPEMGGVVNRWLDHFRMLDNNARRELVNSLTNRINAEGELVDAYVSFEKKKRQLLHLDEILDLEDKVIRNQIAASEFELEEEEHKRELRRRERERELNPQEPEPVQNSKPPRRNRGPSKAERLQTEAESIVQHGTYSDRGKIADAAIAELKSQYGDDENSWPEEVQENIRRLRIWKLRDA